MARQRRRAGALALTVLAALALAACGDDDSDASTQTTVATDDSGGEETEAYDTVSVTMVDYAYEVSGALKAGGTLEVSNSAAEFHMIGIGRLAEGKTLEDVKAALLGATEQDGTVEEAATEEAPAGEEEGEGEEPLGGLIEDVGMPGQIMGPGSSASVTVPKLAAGTYALVCFLNVEGEETPHFAKGMIDELEVVADEAEGPGEPDATYTTSAGKAVEGPAELKAGRRLLRFDAAGEGGGELEPGIIKLDDGVTIEEFAKSLAVFDEEGLPKNAADTIPGEFIVGLFDFDDNTTVYVSVDLKPGTYIVTAQDTDADDVPDIPVERLEIKVT